MHKFGILAFVIAIPVLIDVVSIDSAAAASHGRAEGMSDGAGAMMGPGMMGEGLMTPSMDSTRGRKLFASKGCVVCHSVNGVGGEDAPPLDASTMPFPMNPFEFTAKMWRGAEAMIYVQREELGEQIEFNGQELADIIAFVHDAGEQTKFSKADIPPRIEALMQHMVEEKPHETEGAHEGDKPNK